LRLIQFKRIDSGSFSLLWDDAHSGTIGIRQLRDACPCAGCKGESVLFQHYVPAPDPSPHPEKYVLQSAEMVGNYALKFVWGDGHGEGLYVWEHLRTLCGCQECSARRGVAMDAAGAPLGLPGVAELPPGVPTGSPTGQSTEHASMEADRATRASRDARVAPKHGPDDPAGKVHAHGR